MGKFLVAIILVGLAGYLVTTYITGDTGSVKSETTRIGGTTITRLSEIEQ